MGKESPADLHARKSLLQILVGFNNEKRIYWLRFINDESAYQRKSKMIIQIQYESRVSLSIFTSGS